MKKALHNFFSISKPAKKDDFNKETEFDQFELISLEKDQKTVLTENLIQNSNEDKIMQKLRNFLQKSLENCIPKKTQEQLAHETPKFGKNKNCNMICCKMHSEKTARFICVSEFCPLIVHCTECQKRHAKTCDRNRMSESIHKLLNRGFVDEFYNLEDFDLDLDNDLETIGRLVEDCKSYLSSQLDRLKQDFFDKIKRESKESNRKRLAESLEKKRKEFEGGRCF